MRVPSSLAVLAALGSAVWLAWPSLVSSAVPSAGLTAVPRFVLPAEVHEVTDLARDGAGNLVVAGTTYDPDFPTTADAADRTCGSDGDAFVMVIAGDGSLRYSTCVGEGSTEWWPKVAVTASGRVWVAAATCLHVTPPGMSDCSVEQFRARLWGITPGAPASLQGPMWVGGPDALVLLADLAAARDGSVWVLGTAHPSPLQTVNAWQPVMAGPSDLILGHYAEGRTEPLLLTFLGGSGHENASRLAVASDGDVLVSGHSSSADFPVVPSIQGVRGDGPAPSDVVLARLDVTGRWLEYSLDLGFPSESYEDVLLAVDAVGHALLVGRASFGDFPLTAPSVPRDPRRDVYLLDVDESGRVVSSGLVETGVGGILARDLCVGPVFVGARPDESVVVVGAHFSDDLLAGGVFVALTDRFGDALRPPELVLPFGAGLGGLEAVTADACRVWLAWPERQPPGGSVSRHFVTSLRLGDCEWQAPSTAPDRRR